MLRLLLTCLGVAVAVVVVSSCTDNEQVIPTDISVQFCEQVKEGRMTGGGWLGVDADDGTLVKVTHGYTLHCDITLSNNLEINWLGNQWHIDKEEFLSGWPICTDDPAYSPEPPAAPFDTFEGMAVGRLNGVWGSIIHFMLIDNGEPGGKGDRGMIRIWDVGGYETGADPILDVSLRLLSHGNVQAHYDQPHGCNVNKPCD